MRGISGLSNTVTKIYTETMNGNPYCDLLQHQLELFIMKLPKKYKSFLLTESSLLAHIGYCTSKNWQTEVRLTRLDSKNSLFKSFEILWSIIGKKLASKPIYLPMTLMGRLQEEWNNIDHDLCIKLLESMPEHVQKCLKTKGGHFMITIVHIFCYFCFF